MSSCLFFHPYVDKVIFRCRLPYELGCATKPFHFESHFGFVSQFCTVIWGFILTYTSLQLITSSLFTLILRALCPDILTANVNGDELSAQMSKHYLPEDMDRIVNFLSVGHSYQSTKCP